MKKFTIILLGFLALFALNACNTSTTKYGFQKAKRGETTIVYAAMPMSGNDLHSAALDALRARKWTLLDAGNPIKASLSHGGQDARLLISINENTITFDTAGSTIEGKAYVPVRYVDFLYKTMMSRQSKR